MWPLSDLEIFNRDSFLKTMGYDGQIDLEEDCCGAKSYHYEVHPSNLCDTVYVVYKGMKHLISDLDNL